MHNEHYSKHNRTFKKAFWILSDWAMYVHDDWDLAHVSHVADGCDFPNSHGRRMTYLPHHYCILWESTLFSWRVFCVISLIPLNLTLLLIKLSDDSLTLLLIKLSDDSVTIVALLISYLWFCCLWWHVLPMMQLTFCFLSSGKYNHKRVFVCLE
jgi:hypothetical protein